MIWSVWISRLAPANHLSLGHELMARLRRINKFMNIFPSLIFDVLFAISKWWNWIQHPHRRYTSTRATYIQNSNADTRSQYQFVECIRILCDYYYSFRFNGDEFTHFAHLAPLFSLHWQRVFKMSYLFLSISNLFDSYDSFSIIPHRFQSARRADGTCLI